MKLQARQLSVDENFRRELSTELSISFCIADIETHDQVGSIFSHKYDTLWYFFCGNHTLRRYLHMIDIFSKCGYFVFGEKTIAFLNAICRVQTCKTANIIRWTWSRECFYSTLCKTAITLCKTIPENGLINDYICRDLQYAKRLYKCTVHAKYLYRNISSIEANIYRSKHAKRL